jgi:anti-anti-sigma factor
MADGLRAFRDGILVELPTRSLVETGVLGLAEALAEMSQERDSSRWYLDCSGVEYLTSRVLAQLLLLDRRLREEGGRLSLLNLSPCVYEFLRAIRLTSILDVYRGGERVSV